MTFGEELKELLEKELIALKKLETIAFEKTDIIVNNQVEKLEELIKEEEDLINEIGLLEVARMQLLDTWGVAVDTPLSNVIEKVLEYKEELVHISNSMSEILEKLNIRNNLNNDLIRENLDWIDFNMNLIAGIEQPTSYGKDNKDNLKAGGNSIFDRKV